MGLAASLNAELARNVLDAEGIPCVLLGEFASRVSPVHGVLLRVERKNAVLAAEILESYFDNVEDAPTSEE
jgi:hypothetical protein